MVTNSKVLTVSYGTFSCTLEGFDDSFEAMKAIAEYFRDLAAEDRYFGAEPPTPDADTLARIAEREIERRVDARTDQGTLVLTAGDAISEAAPAVQEEVEPVEEAIEDDVAEFEAEEIEEAQVAEGEETTAIDEDELAAERAAFFAEADTIASEHSSGVADEVASHVEEEAEEQETVSEELAREDVNASTDVEDDAAPMVLEAEALVEPSSEETADLSDELENELDDLVAESAETTVEEATEIEEEFEEEIEEDAESFFADAKPKADEGVSSIAAKLSRIRAVVSKAEEASDQENYSEDEHAENPAADFLRKSASDIEGSLEDEDEHERAPEAKSGRVIRMRRSEQPVEDAAEEFAPAEVEEPVAEQIEDVVGEDTIAEFENGYTAVELDEDTFDEEVETPREPHHETPVRPRRARVDLTESAPQEESMDRLLDEANSKLGAPDANRRRTTLAHLRAAVAATRAEKDAGTYKANEDQSGAYREDLADVMRPRREAPQPAQATEEDGGAPLRLVASQRVDAPEQDVAIEDPIRPRRVSPQDIASFEPSEASDFAEYAEEVGATELPDILEAAASYLTYVEGRRRFSRPMLMRLAYQLGPDRFQREAGLRSFGQLLREKKIEKIAGGRFTAAETIRFKPEDRAAV